MGYTIYYKVIREHALSADEQVALADHARAWRSLEWEREMYALTVATNERRDGLIAEGYTKVGYDLESTDAQQLLEALTELRGLLEQAVVYVRDDLELVAWDPGDGAYVFAEPHEQQWPPSSSIDDGVLGHALADSVTVSGDEAPAPVYTASELLRALADLDGGAIFRSWAMEPSPRIAPPSRAAQLEKLLRGLPPDEVQRAAWSEYGDMCESPAWPVVDALAADADPEAVASEVLAVWMRSDTDSYWHSGLETRLPRAFVSAPSIEAQLIADLVNWQQMHSASEQSRVAVAARLLGTYDLSPSVQQTVVALVPDTVRDPLAVDHPYSSIVELCNQIRARAGDLDDSGGEEQPPRQEQRHQPAPNPARHLTTVHDIGHRALHVDSYAARFTDTGELKTAIEARADADVVITEVTTVLRDADGYVVEVNRDSSDELVRGQRTLRWSAFVRPEFAAATASAQTYIRVREHIAGRLFSAPLPSPTGDGGPMCAPLDVAGSELARICVGASVAWKSGRRGYAFVELDPARPDIVDERHELEFKVIDRTGKIRFVKTRRLRHGTASRIVECRLSVDNAAARPLTLHVRINGWTETICVI